MYARSTTIRGIPQSIDAGTDYVRDEVMPAVRGMDGCVGLSLLADRESGMCIVTTSWRDREAMHASAEGVRSMRDRAGQVFGGEYEVQEWEVSAMHRRHEAHHGGFTVKSLIASFREAGFPAGIGFRRPERIFPSTGLTLAAWTSTSTSRPNSSSARR